MRSEDLMDTLFKLENLNFKDILTYEDIVIKESKITLITGESGSGKSTLLKLLNASLSPSQGEIIYKGENLKDMDTLELRRKVILIGQNVYLFDGNIRENFHKYYEYRGLENLDDETMIKYLKICQANFSLESSSLTLSGGERQRIYIAICLSFHPEVLMMDEPTSALDQKTAIPLTVSLIPFCKEQGITLLIVSHDESSIGPYADESIVIRGRG